jgi:putative heme-binding domain-containing protein
VPESYRVSSVNLKDERVLTGIITARSAQAITLQTTTEKVTVPTKDIESIRESELSMMPDGLLDALNDQQVSDLAAYLMSSNASARVR